MSGDTKQFSRRRVLGGLVTVGGASAAAGAGTMAYFSDSESSTNNTIQAGTLDLTLNSQETFTFSSALAPTQSTSGSITLVNSGSITGASLDIDVAYSEPQQESPGETDMTAQQVAENLEVVTLDYGSANIFNEPEVPSNPTLHDLANNDHSDGESIANDIVDLDDPGSDGKTFTVELKLKDVSDDFQSDGISVDFTFHLNQTDGQ